MATARHPQVVIKVNEKNFPALLAKAKIIYAALLAAAATFMNPLPLLPALLILIEALDAAMTAAATRGKGLAAARDLKADAVASALESERAMVQVLVDQNPQQAQALAELAGMTLADIGVHVKALLALTQGTQPGIVNAEANFTLLKQGRGKAKKTTVNWRYTLDGGKTFVLSSTPVARTVFTGIPAASTVGVQVCITDSGGTTEWSQVVSITLH